MYGADPAAVSIAHPGVDLDVFAPGDQAAARARLGLPQDAVVLLFAGRIQPLKGPDLLLQAAALLAHADAGLRERLVVAVVGGPSGSGLEHPEALVTLADDQGIRDRVRFAPPATQAVLADWYRAATLVAVPSRNESFGLVALEAQACGTPVVAAAVGGLRTAVADGMSGLLVHDHDPQAWARAMDRLVRDPDARDRLGRGARLHARRFGWDATARAVLDCYAQARAALESERLTLLPQAQ
jgi:D-inositol-3-phosphate glycosyltransferase